MTDTAPAPTSEWEQRVEALWASFDDHAPEDFLARAASLAAELPDGHPAALFELASAHDALDGEEQAAAYYRDALAAGLGDERRRQAVIGLPPWIPLASVRGGNGILRSRAGNAVRRRGGAASAPKYGQEVTG